MPGVEWEGGLKVDNSQGGRMVSWPGENDIWDD